MVDSDCFDGTISPGEFRTAASALAERWKKSASSGLPPWSWASPPRQHSWLLDQVDGYVAMEKLRFCRSSKVDDNTCCNAMEEPGCADDDDEPVVDDATLVESGDQEMHHYYDLHIVYSSSYRVPVLYFRVYGSDGQPLSLAEFERDLPVGSADEFLKSKWTFITQEEHPFLNRPWYKLHPCGTSEWLRLLFCSDASVLTREAAVELYLVSWFSFVGQVFGLGVTSDMMKNRKQL
ncbi:ubiquitin-like-conjugating enzyme ATG10 [Punica granatum]|uniref:Ubiquitin-like-conjugating enzyme ATG10 n=1 Tax=Punica granatum TaxID=22663 RepID=A0A6P8BUG2_PUNGR|nr:ubiquitin-like-conjugating enzyme ATG10 [Punica granatum]